MRTEYMSVFEIKDSGQRAQFNSGMQRDVTEDKMDPSLVMDGPMFLRWVEHLTNGAKKYDKRNWMKANSEEELNRFRESALRHFVQWFYGHRDEDHAAAVMFNINGAEYVQELLNTKAVNEMPAGKIQPLTPVCCCSRHTRAGSGKCSMCPQHGQGRP